MTTLAQQDDTEVLLELFNTADSGPSPYGISYWSSWIECAKKAHLRQAERDARAENGDDDLVTLGGAGINLMQVGIQAHKLFEGRVKRQLGTELIWDARATVFDVNFLEAIRLYREYHRVWGSIEERWGCRVIGAELPLGGGSVAEQVAARLGGPLTGRADAIIEIIDPDKAKFNTGLTLMPGRYIWDLKTGKAHNATDEVKFREGLQAQAYLWLETLELGERGSLGMIFDRCVAHKDISRKSYAGFVAYPDINAEERLRALVTAGVRAKALGAANPLACLSQYGKVCWFKQNGQCGGF